MTKPPKQKRLEAKGFRFSSAADFLGLTLDEMTYIELKAALSRDFRDFRI